MSKRAVLHSPPKLRGYLCTLYRYQPIKRDITQDIREDEIWHHSTKVVQNVQHHYGESDSLSHLISLKLSMARALSTKANVILKDAKDWLEWIDEHWQSGTDFTTCHSQKDTDYGYGSLDHNGHRPCMYTVWQLLRFIRSPESRCW